MQPTIQIPRATCKTLDTLNYQIYVLPVAIEGFEHLLENDNDDTLSLGYLLDDKFIETLQIKAKYHPDIFLIDSSKINYV